MAEVPQSSIIIEPDWASYQVYLKNGTEANEGKVKPWPSRGKRTSSDQDRLQLNWFSERNPIFNQRVKNVKMQFKLPRMDPDELYQFKDIIGRDASDFSEKVRSLSIADTLRIIYYIAYII